MDFLFQVVKVLYYIAIGLASIILAAHFFKKSYLIITQKPTMRYLVTTNEHPPFFTDNFDGDNHFSPGIGMVVYDLAEFKYTEDGYIWLEIKFDFL